MITVQPIYNENHSGRYVVRWGSKGEIIREFPFTGPGISHSAAHTKARMYAEGFRDGKAAMAVMF